MVSSSCGGTIELLENDERRDDSSRSAAGRGPLSWKWMKARKSFARLPEVLFAVRFETPC